MPHLATNEIYCQLHATHASLLIFIRVTHIHASDQSSGESRMGSLGGRMRTQWAHLCPTPLVVWLSRGVVGSMPTMAARASSLPLLFSLFGRILL